MSDRSEHSSDSLSFSCNGGSNSENVPSSEGESPDQNTSTNYSESHDPFQSSPAVQKPVISVARRNERERKRVRLVNQGFAILRERVPRDRCSRGRRSSKVETLRAAILYIRQLQQLLLESQNRFQEQSMTYCYGYIGDELMLNSPVTSGCDGYPPTNGFPVDIRQSSSYHPFAESFDIQHPNQFFEHHLAMPWIT